MHGRPKNPDSGCNRETEVPDEYTGYDVNLFISSPFLCSLIVAADARVTMYHKATWHPLDALIKVLLRVNTKRLRSTRGWRNWLVWSLSLRDLFRKGSIFCWSLEKHTDGSDVPTAVKLWLYSSIISTDYRLSICFHRDSASNYILPCVSGTGD